MHWLYYSQDHRKTISDTELRALIIITYMPHNADTFTVWTSEIELLIAAAQMLET